MDKYNKKKQRNQLASIMAKKYASQRMEKLVMQCCNWIQFLENKDRDIHKWLNANSCGWRFCPMCAMRKAYKDALKISVVMEWIAKECNKEFIFLTLTVPNVYAVDLPATINDLGKGWIRLLDRASIRYRVCHGYIRKLEITYDKNITITPAMWDGTGEFKGRARAEYYQRHGLKIGDANPSYDTYHPHFHAVIAVNRSYFKSRDYISHEKWLNLWRESMRNPLITQVDIRRVKRSGHGFDVMEFAKYNAKDSDYLVNADVFDVFYSALKGRQTQTFNGLFAEGNRKFKAGELDAYINPDLTEYMYEVFYRWRKSEYTEADIRQLDPKKDWHLANRGVIIAPTEETPK